MSFLKIPLFALALTPLVYFPDALFPFVFPKTVFIQLAVAVFWVGFAICLAADLYRSRRIHTDIRENPRPVISNNQHSPISINQRPVISINPHLFKNKIFLAVSAFLALVAISIIFAVNPYRAFWGNIERGDGLVSLLFFFGFFVGALAVFSAKDWKIFFGLTIGTAITLFAVQIFTPMTGSLVGNTTFLSAFYLFAIFSAAMLLASRPRIAGRDTPLAARSNNIPTFLRPVVSFALLLGLRMSEYLSFESAIRIGLIIVIALSTAGIFIGQTRGAILGLVIGIVAVLLYFAFYQHKSARISVNQQKISVNQHLRIISIALLFFILSFGIVFAITRHLPLWQNIPGIARIAAITWEDPTLQTRLISAGIGINAINPANEGIIRTLFGWGQENFISAYSEHYDPRFFRYEHTWFDRAHNKLIDVLVMNGALGLIAYLAIWFFVFKLALSRQNPRESAAMLFFATAYFVQNLFAFENVSTYIPFFAFLAFVASLSTQIHADTKQIYADKEFTITSQHKSAFEQNQRKSVWNQRKSVLAVLAVALFFVAMFAVTFMTFLQSIIWTRSFAAKEPETVLAAFNFWSSPYTFGQTEIRRFALTSAMGIPDLSHPVAAEIYLRSLRLAEESALREATNPQAFISVAAGHELIGNLEMAEKHRLKIVELAPRRQDALYALAWVYVRQGRNEEAMALAEQMLQLDPYSPRSKIYYAVITGTTASKSFDEVTNLVFGAIEGPVRFSPLGQDIAMMRNLFQFYIAAFYRQRNEERFLEAMERARLFEERYDAGRALEIQQGVDAFRQFGWDAIALEE